MSALGLLQAWHESGARSVAILQGFSGIGKTWTVNQYRRTIREDSVSITIPDGGLQTFDLLFEIASELEVKSIDEMTSRADGDLSRGMEDALRQPLVVILDNFENLLDRQSTPPKDLLDLLRRIGRRGDRGRLLLVSNQAMEDGEWEDDIDLITYPTQPACEALQTLNHILAAKDVGAKISSGDRDVVVRWLGGNPRAMKALAACLQFEPLEDIFGPEPHEWEAKDQAISPTLVEKLERRIVGRLLAKLDPPTALLLSNLSILRRPFARAAIDRQSDAISDPKAARNQLVSSFILTVDDQSGYSINPVARQVVGYQLQRAESELKRAHRFAAGYYSRHFHAQGESGKLHGVEFVEARYHLLALNERQEFENLTARFRSRQLKHLRNAAIQVPDTPEKLTELIVTFGALLADEDDAAYPDLRFLLSRLCLRRGFPGDELLGLRQLRLATHSMPDIAVWRIYTRVLAKIEGAAAVARAARASARRFTTSQATDIKAVAVNALADAGKLNEALAFSEEATGSIRDYESRASIYLIQTAAGLLLRTGRYPDAMELLDETRMKTSTANDMYNRLVEAAAFPALARRDTHRLKRLRDSIPAEPRRFNEKLMCNALLLQCQGKYAEAAEALELVADEYPAAGLQYVFCHMVIGNLDRASSKLIILGRQVRSRRIIDWLQAAVHIKGGRSPVARESLSRYLGRPLTANEASDSYFWVRIWDAVPLGISDYPAYYFPCLPAQLTGLGKDLFRLESAESALLHVSLDEAEAPPVDNAYSNAIETKAMEHESANLPIVIVSAFGGADSGRSKTTSGNNVVGVTVGDVYNVNQAGAVGRHAKASDFVQAGTNTITDSTDLDELGVQLGQLVKHLRGGELDEDQLADVELLESAKASAESGNLKATKSRLARVRSWALGAATAIGTSLAAAAIKSAIEGS